MNVIVTVMPKRTVLDPQGAATAEAMRHLGLDARGVRVGKSIQFTADFPAGTSREDAEKKLHEIARDLLSNPVMEEYHIETYG